MKPRRAALRDGFQFLLVLAAMVGLTACFPVETAPVATGPTLNEVRSQGVRGANADDARLRPGETQAEVSQVDRSRGEISAITPEGWREILPYNLDHTRVTYHARDYTIDNLESGDLIAYRSIPTGTRYVETIRIEEPVQARGESRYARSAPARPHTEVIDGTVERIDPNLGVFDIVRAAAERLPYRFHTTPGEQISTVSGRCVGAIPSGCRENSLALTIFNCCRFCGPAKFLDSRLGRLIRPSRLKLFSL